LKGRVSAYKEPTGRREGDRKERRPVGDWKVEKRAIISEEVEGKGSDERKEGPGHSDTPRIETRGKRKIG